MTLILRPYQRNAVDSLFDYFIDGGTGHPLVVAPTGSGKSVLIAAFAGEVLEHWPNQRILILAHRKELLEQNAAKILRMVPPGITFGIYSAGLQKRQLGRAITMAGIQSVHRRAHDIGWISLIIIDEAHLIPSASDGMYRRLLDGLTAINPQLRVIGFTATPFRMTTGMLTDGEGRLFTDIAYDIGIGDLVRDGYLAPLVSKAAVTQADLSDVRTSGGEFVMASAEHALNRDALTEAALDEVMRYGADRRKWLVFCAGVAHAEQVAAIMNRRGINTRCITGETVPMVRDTAIAQFRRGELRALTNCDVLTTGFDAPEIDLIVLLRPTRSPGLYIQMAGRAMRPSPGKANALIMDFAGNIERHGPIDMIRVRSKSDNGEGVQTAPVKICHECREPVAISAKECACGYLFPEPRRAEHEREASSASPMGGHAQTELLEIDYIDYRRHQPRDVSKRVSLRVTYCTRGGRIAEEWVCFEHDGFAGKKARRWWIAHAGAMPPPVTVDEALERRGELRPVTQVAVRHEGQFDRITTFTLGERRETIAESRPDSDLFCLDGIP